MWLKVTGMIPPQEGHSWSSGGILIEPLTEADSNWADGTRRAVWPLQGKLNAAGTAFVTFKNADLKVPGADIGETALPPKIRVIIDLVDNEGRSWRGVASGRIAASAVGEWNVNAPLTGIVPTATNEGPNNWLQLTVLDLQTETQKTRDLNAGTVQLQADIAQDREATQAATASAISAAADAAGQGVRRDQARKKLNKLKGYRAGAGTFTGASKTTASYTANTGSGTPISPIDVPQLVQFAVTATGLAYAGMVAPKDTDFTSGTPVSAGFWVNRVELAAIASGMDVLFQFRDGVGTQVATGLTAALTPAQLAVAGTQAALGTGGTMPADLRVITVEGDWSYVSASLASLSTTAFADVVLYPRFNATATGVMRLAAPALITGLSRAEAVIYPETATELDPVQAIKNTEVMLAAKPNAPLPLKPAVFMNALRGRYSSTAGSALSARLLAESGMSATYAFNDASFNTRGEPNIIRVQGSPGAGAYKNVSLFISPADLAAIGVVPNDASPPTVSVRVGFLKGSLVGIDPANILTPPVNGSVQIWLALRYGGSASNPLYDTVNDRTWVNTAAVSQYNTPGATTGAVSRTDDGTRILYQRAGVPIPATLGGKPFTGMLIEFVIRGSGSALSFELDQLAVIAGSNLSAAGNYINTEDALKSPVTLSDLDSTARAALEKLGSLARIISSAGVYYVASPTSSTELCVTRWARSGLNNVFQPTGVAFIPASTADADLAGVVNGNLTQFIDDDPAPLRFNYTMAGGNHGHNTTRILTTSAAHGLSMEDIGSRWQDGAGKLFTLAEIPSSTTLRIAQDVENLATGGWRMPATAPITGTTLTHVSGALHTTALTVTGDLAPPVYQDIPAVRAISYTYMAGQTPVAATGVYSATEFTVTEEYEVLDYRSLMTYLQGRAGSTTPVDYLHTSVIPAARVKLTYRIRGAETLVDAMITAGVNPITHQGTGVVQAQPFTPGTGKLRELVQDTLPIAAAGGTYDLGTGADITTLTDYLTLTPATWAIAGVPPSRFKQTVTTAGGVPLYSLEVGYSETHGIGRPTVRNAMLGGNQAGYIASFKKQYPALTYTAQAAGTRLTVQAFRRYSRG